MDRHREQIARRDPSQSEVFVDTSGFFALLCASDPAHTEAVHNLAVFARTSRRAVTSDYVLDETYTLLKARRLRHLCPRLRETVKSSRTLRLEWTHPALFERGVEFYLKSLDQDLSLTDCLSFLVMREQGITDALTTDHHFRVAGFTPLLKP